MLFRSVAREVCGEAALYVAEPDPAAVAEALDALLFDQGTRQRILGHAPAVLARYSWTDCAARLLRIVESVA